LLPTPGQAAVVRNRPALIKNVITYSDSGHGDAHFVEVEYLDGAGIPDSETVLWECELGARSLTSLRLPNLHAPDAQPARQDSFEALIDAVSWSSIGRSAEVDGGQQALVAPWHSSVQVEDYQVYPVLKAIAMPRVSLMLADGVGLGKTIEAGLIATELLSRRRIRRMLVLCPASLQEQWREELWDKFSLEFAVLDRERSLDVQRELGMDANPWATTHRIITSMDYLRQADVRERFLVAARGMTQVHVATAPWDLIIVDEAHNLTPDTHGDDSQRCQMLRDIMPFFEHRLFLTATPHNGHTTSFSGLLELLDPVRFQQKPELSEADRRHVSVTVVRRLKSVINQRSIVPRFAKREVSAVPVVFDDPRERRLFETLSRYRTQLRSAVAAHEQPKHLRVAQFMLSVLTKRLLSCSYAFARTWWTHVEGYDLRGGFEEASHAVRRAEEDLADDIERDLRERDAVRQGGAWLKGMHSRVGPLVDAVSAAVTDLGWPTDRVRAEEFSGAPPPDARWDALAGWIQEHLVRAGVLSDSERLIVFTEYRDTLSYLLWRMGMAGHDQPVVRTLIGGASSSEREDVKREFNDSRSLLRILVATDAASEGLNLQRACRYVFHQDVPWNPMRLEQRNGRVDRHGQARDVFVHHFASHQEADLAFLARVAEKVHQVREDLGSVSKVIDDAFDKHFGEGAPVPDLDSLVDGAAGRAVAKDDTMECDDGGDEADYAGALQALRATELRLGLTSERLARLLGKAMEADRGELALDGHATESTTLSYVIKRVPPTWEKLIDETVRIGRGDQRASLPKLVFDPAYFEEEIDGRRVYLPRPDALLVRLGHPLMRRAVGVFRRSLWESEGAGRWTVLSAPLPEGAEAVLALHVLSTATNELRETVEEEVATWAYIVRGERLEQVSDSYWEELRTLRRSELPARALTTWTERLTDLWLAHRKQLEARLASLRTERRDELESSLPDGLARALATEKEAYASRLRDLEAEGKPKATERLERQVARAQREAQQLSLLEEENVARRARLRDLGEQLDKAQFERRASQIALLRQRLEHERDRTLEQVLPRRYALAHSDVQPVAVEYWVRPGRGEA